MTAAEKKKAKKKAREKAKKAGGDADDAAAPAAAKKGGKKVIHCCSAYMPSVVCALVTALSSRTHLCSMFTERTRHFHDCNCFMTLPCRMRVVHMCQSSQSCSTWHRPQERLTCALVVQAISAACSSLLVLIRRVVYRLMRYQQTLPTDSDQGESDTHSCTPNVYPEVITE